MKIICERCNAGERTVEAWIGHLISSAHQSRFPNAPPITTWTLEENERTLVITPTKKHKSFVGGLTIHPEGVIWHFGQYGLTADFYSQTDMMFYLIQLDSKAGLEDLRLPGTFTIDGITVHVRRRGSVSIEELRQLETGTLLHRLPPPVPPEGSNRSNSNFRQENPNTAQSNNITVRISERSSGGQSGTPGYQETGNRNHKPNLPNNGSMKGATVGANITNNMAASGSRPHSNTTARSGKPEAKQPIQPKPSTSANNNNNGKTGPPNVTANNVDMGARKTAIIIRTGSPPKGTGTGKGPDLKPGVRPSNHTTSTSNGSSSDQGQSSPSSSSTKSNYNPPNNENNGNRNGNAGAQGKQTNNGPSKNQSQSDAVRERNDFLQRHQGLTRTAARTNQSLDDQLLSLIRSISLTDAGNATRAQVMLDLQKILRQDFPDCTLSPFGSYVTGLGNNDSDIDIHVNINGDDPNSKSMSKPNAFHATKRLLHRRARGLFTHVIAVENTRVPILKIQHHSGIHCDLSFENGLSVKNSELIAFYQRLDSRVKDLIVLIRYWAIYHELAGSTNIKNYSLALLVLVFLAKKKIVPSLHALQTIGLPPNSASASPAAEQLLQVDMVDRWNAGYCKNYAVVKRFMQENGYGLDPPVETVKTTGSPTANSLLRLAADFFEMYGQFDYANNMICTLLAEFLPKSKFAPGYEDELQDELDFYKDWAVGHEPGRRLNITTAFCLQDPFQLSFNVQGIAKSHIIDDFKLCCTETAKSIRTLLLERPSSSSPASPPPNLFNIFTQLRADKLTKSQRRLIRKMRESIESRVSTAAAGGAGAPSGLVAGADLSTESMMKLKFTPLQTFNLHNKYKCFKDFFHLEEDVGLADLDSVGSGHIVKDSQLYSLWCLFALDFIRIIFSNGYCMKVLKSDPAVGIGNVPAPPSASTSTSRPAAAAASSASTASPMDTEAALDTKKTHKRHLSTSPPNGENRQLATNSGTTTDTPPNEDVKISPTFAKPSAKFAKTEISANKIERQSSSSPSPPPPQPVTAAAAAAVEAESDQEEMLDIKELSQLIEGSYSEEKESGAVGAGAETEEAAIQRKVVRIAEAFDKLPSLDHHDKTTVRLELQGHRNFWIEHDEISKNVEKTALSRGILDPVELEGEATRIALKRARGPGVMKFEAIGSISMENMNDSADSGGPMLAVPAFTIEIPISRSTDTNLKMCKEFFASKLGFVFLKYLDYRASGWIASA